MNMFVLLFVLRAKVNDLTENGKWKTERKNQMWIHFQIISKDLF